MNERLKYDVPSEFSDDELWLKIFHKHQLIIACVMFAITIFLFKFLSLFGMKWVGLIVGLIATFIVTGSTFIFVPEQDYLKGANLSMDIIILRKLLRKWNARIYVKGYGDKENV